MVHLGLCVKILSMLIREGRKEADVKVGPRIAAPGQKLRLFGGLQPRTWLAALCLGTLGSFGTFFTFP